MTIRNLDYLFKAKSVAIVGASKTPSSVGAVLSRNLFKAGFDGPIMPVNPNHDHIQSVRTYPNVKSLPVVADLAVIATPPKTVPGLIAELAEAGTRAVVVLTAGLGEAENEGGLTLRQAMLNAARPSLLRIVGPNCLGIMVPPIGLNASFGDTQPIPGHLAFVAQSGAIVTSVVSWATARGIGFSHLVSLGDMADVDFGDMLDYLANDRGTRAILLYVEAVRDARKFMSAARAAARMKPVIVVKSGRHEAGARAAASHTGALAGSDEVYDSAFRRAGMLRVFDLDELFDAVETLATLTQPRGDRLAILTNGGGIGVMATDSLTDAGGTLASLSAETVARLDKVLPPTWSRANPVDIIGDAPAKRYADALAALFEDKNLDGILVLHCPTAIASGTEAARAVIETISTGKTVPVLTSWVGDGLTQDARRLFDDSNLPSYDTPTQAVRAFMHTVDYRRNQQMLMETPPSVPEAFTPDTALAQAVIEKAREDGREWLLEPEAKQVLAAYGIPVAGAEEAETPALAAEIAARLGGSVALKILSPDITHKTDFGGVALNLQGPRAVQIAAEAMLERISTAEPDARLRGFVVEPMMQRPGAFELIIGVSEDAQFGPMILFGQGGTAVEIIGDKALALPPLNMHLARELMSRTRIYKLLQGYRDLPSVNLDAVMLTLIKVSQLVIDLGDVVELDINPLLADEYGVMALDARMRVMETTQAGTDRLAIRPYPKELEETIPLGDGRVLLLRPVVPEDEPSLQRSFAKLSPEQVRLRFFVPMKTLSHVQAARFSQIDYDREMALVLTEPGIPGKTEIYGVVQISADPNNERAEYAIVVRHDMTGIGLGILLMRRIIDYARGRGIGQIFGDVLRENTTMLKLCEALGFRKSFEPDEPDIVRVTLEL